MTEHLLRLWIMGRPGSGKTTLAQQVCQYFREQGKPMLALDGDEVRKGLGHGLGFSCEDRAENIRRVVAVCHLAWASGISTVCSLITPTHEHQALVRELTAPHGVVLVYLDCALAVCEQRDRKGLYRGARAGAVSNFTGISSPFEIPRFPDLVIDTQTSSAQVCFQMLLDHLQ